MNQIACPYCRGVISGQGIAPGQLLVCPHCGRQFVRPGGTPAAAPAAAGSSTPAAAPAPARAPSAAPAAPRSAAVAQGESETGFAARYAEQRQAQSSSMMIWIVVGAVVGILLLVVLGGTIWLHQIDRRHGEIEPGLYQEALKHITANDKNRAKVIELLDLEDAEVLILDGDHVNFNGNEATVFLKAKGKKKFITLKFRLKNGEWSIDGPINVKGAK